MMLLSVEIDAELAEDLRRRMPKQNVTILCEDATRMSLPDACVDAAVCITMLHHLPSARMQDQLLAEIAWTLRPGGILAGTDSLDSRFFRLIHAFDTLVVVDPTTFTERLSAAGFEDAVVDVNPYAFRFRARKPLKPERKSLARDKDQ
jgi:SAM-dependent methyltransferase